MSYVRENDSTQNAHIKHSNDSRQKPTWKNTETIRHMRDSNTCRIMGKEYQTMTNKEKFAEQILDIACGGSKIAVDKATLEPTSCYKLACKNCLFSFGNGGCRDARKKWANSEYVEPPIDWSKVAVDTPILVRDNSFSEWGKRYFAKYENGGVFAWSNGATSWSSEGHATAWGLAKLPERSKEWD